jgi:CheY-like chemotaxis protein
MESVPEARCPLPILVVDDDDDILRMTSFVLKQLGYEVATANNGPRGIADLQAKRYTPCLILLDLMMPSMDGVSFRKKLLEIPSVAEVPVVILSGDNELASKVSELKIAGFEQKPISVQRLAALAAKYCRPAD